MILEWNKSCIELTALFVHPKNSLQSHLRAIMALGQSRLSVENKSILGQQIRPNFLRSTSLLDKILPTNLGACKPTFYTFCTSHLRRIKGLFFVNGFITMCNLKRRLMRAVFWILLQAMFMIDWKQTAKRWQLHFETTNNQ